MFRYTDRSASGRAQQKSGKMKVELGKLGRDTYLFNRPSYISLWRLSGNKFKLLHANEYAVPLNFFAPCPGVFKAAYVARDFLTVF